MHTSVHSEQEASTPPRNQRGNQTAPPKVRRSKKKHKTITQDSQKVFYDFILKRGM